MNDVITNPRRWVERALIRAKSITPRPMPKGVSRSGFFGFAYENYHSYTIKMLEELSAKGTWTNDDTLKAITCSNRLEGTIMDLGL
jgi:hypothetical protein